MKFSAFVTSFTLIVQLFHKIECARILGVFMGGGQSHYNLGKMLLKTLAEAGHEVVLMSQYGDEKIPLIDLRFGDQKIDSSKYKEIFVHDEEHSDTLFDSLMNTNRHPFEVIDQMYQNGKRIIPKVFENPEVKTLLNTTFDLVIVEQIFTDALKVFAWHFKTPLIVFHPLRADTWVNSYVGNPTFPSYVPEYLAGYDSAMIFFERLVNVIDYLYDTIFREFVCLREQNEIMKKYFPNAPDLSDIAYNTSLVLLNSDISIDVVIPKVPNMIDIGGFHMVTSKPLPTDVTSFLNNSTKGVIYMNLDVLTSNYLSEEVRNLFVKVFSTFEEDFLWQWDDESVPDQPPNVVIRRSLPPQDVLAHSNIKVFINLGDVQSILEGVNYGIPQLLLPVLDDQLYNSAEAQHKGYAWTVPFAKLTENELSWALHELLENSKYLNESRRRSKIFKEKLIPPKKAALYWVDHVLKTNGAKHMRAAALEYSWYQVFMLDLLGFVLMIILLIIVVLKYLISFFCRKYCCCRNKKDKDEYSVNESIII